MKQSNSGSENVRAGARRQACRRVSAVPLHYPHGGVHSLIPFPLTHSPYPFPDSILTFHFYFTSGEPQLGAE